MGAIAISTSLKGHDSKASDEKIKRQTVIKSAAAVTNKGIPIQEYFHTQKQMPSSLKYTAYSVISKIINESMIYPDLVWHCKYFSSACKKPNWSGYMQNTFQGNFPGASTVTFLPQI